MLVLYNNPGQMNICLIAHLVDFSLVLNYINHIVYADTFTQKL